MASLFIASINSFSNLSSYLQIEQISSSYISYLLSFKKSLNLIIYFLKPRKNVSKISTV